MAWTSVGSTNRPKERSEWCGGQALGCSPRLTPRQYLGVSNSMCDLAAGSAPCFAGERTCPGRLPTQMCWDTLHCPLVQAISTRSLEPPCPHRSWPSTGSLPPFWLRCFARRLDPGAPPPGSGRETSFRWSGWAKCRQTVHLLKRTCLILFRWFQRELMSLLEISSDFFLGTRKWKKTFADCWAGNSRGSPRRTFRRTRCIYMMEAGQLGSTSSM